MFNPSASDLVGIAPATLQKWLLEAQLAHHNLMTGSQGEALSYTQGDGTKSITFTRTNVGQLTAYIQLLKAQLGITSGRRPVRFVFR